jgi:hypothetical protein
MRTRYDDEDIDKVGIVRLLSNGVYKAAYPLHDGRAVKDDSTNKMCARRVSGFRVPHKVSGLGAIIKTFLIIAEIEI